MEQLEPLSYTRYWHLPSHNHLMLPFGMEEVHGPEEVMNGMPLNVAVPLSSVKRFCTRGHSKEKKKEFNESIVIIFQMILLEREHGRSKTIRVWERTGVILSSCFFLGFKTSSGLPSSLDTNILLVISIIRPYKSKKRLNIQKQRSTKRLKRNGQWKWLVLV